MNVLLITVAGTSTRFSASIGRPCLKCIYHEGDVRDTILYRLLEMSVHDRIIIVGGYMFEALKEFLSDVPFADKAILVNNEEYADYGSGYSLYLGLKKALEMGADEIVFAEGDLSVPDREFKEVCGSLKNVITYNHEPIMADRSVVLYSNEDGRIVYLYDAGHKVLEIKEPFISIYNSGQIWKFIDRKGITDAMEEMDEKDWKGTNLTFIQRYFDMIDPKNVEFIGFSEWVNCNTVADYRRTLREIQ